MEKFNGQKYKINLIKAMIFRTLKIVSKCFLEKELNLLKSIFIKSGYPMKLLNNIFEIVQNQFYTKVKNFDVPKQEIYFGLEYSNQNTEKFLNRIKRVCDKFSPGFFKYLVYFKSRNKLLQKFSRKFKLYNKNESPGVYKLKCKNCPKVYIGETGRTLEIRTKEHKQLRNFSAVSNHAQKTGHSIDFDNTEILLIEPDTRKRKIIESLFLKIHNVFEGNEGKQLFLF